MTPGKTSMSRYAGLTEVHRPGLSVSNAAFQLRRLAYAEMRLMRLYASRVVTFDQRDIKVLLARLQYEAAQHCDAMRSRILELRVSTNTVNAAPDEALTIFFDEAEHLPEPYPYLAVLTQFIVPAVRDAYHTYLSTTNDLADYPSVRIVRAHVQETEEHLRLLNEALAVTNPTAVQLEQARTWMQQLQAFLGAAGGILGMEAATERLPRRASVDPYHVPHDLKRDDTFVHVWDYDKPPLENVKPHLDYMMGLRLSETNVSEGLGLVLCETPSMPWSFYADISRHLWDEMRHSLFGEAAIEATYGDRTALPMRDYEGVFAFEAELLEHYAVLGLEIEGANMKYPPGKRQEWEFCRDMARHPLMTTFQDYDWADEVLHVHIARRQLDKWFEGGLKHILPFSKSGKEHRTEVKQRHPSVPIDGQPVER